MSVYFVGGEFLYRRHALRVLTSGAGPGATRRAFLAFYDSLHPTALEIEGPFRPAVGCPLLIDPRCAAGR